MSCMPTFEDVWVTTQREQNFGSPYSNLDSLWREYELYMNERLPYLYRLPFVLTSIKSFDCTLDTLGRVMESIKRTPGKPIIKELRLAEVEGDINHVLKLKRETTWYIQREAYSGARWLGFKKGISEAGRKLYMEREMD